MLAWIEIFRESLAAESGDRPPIASLATVDEQHRPNVRSVVCRLRDDGTICVTSDARSSKNRHLRAQPHAALSFWLPKRGEQFRISGRAQLPRNAEVLARTWHEIPDHTRACFFWPDPRSPHNPNKSAFAKAISPSTPPPASFEPILITPDAVEHLIVSTHPHRRRAWTRQTNWQPRDINP